MFNTCSVWIIFLFNGWRCTTAEKDVPTVIGKAIPNPVTLIPTTGIMAAESGMNTTEALEVADVVVTTTNTTTTIEGVSSALIK